MLLLAVVFVYSVAVAFLAPVEQLFFFYCVDRWKVGPSSKILVLQNQM